MNLKERLAALLKDMENAETLEDAQRIKGEIDAVNEKIALAEEKSRILDGLKASDPVEAKGAEAPARTLGEHAARAVKGHNAMVEKFAVTAPDFKAAAVMQLPSTVSAATTDVDTRIVEGYRRPLMIADLFGSESISGNALTYYVESSTVEGGVGTVAQGATKPLTSFGNPTAVTVALDKIGAHYKETAELVEDTPWLASSINGRGMYLHELYVENYLLGKLANTSGIQTGEGIDADAIFGAMMKVQTATGFAADAIVINPADYQTLRLAKDANNQYYGGGYFYGIYGQGQVSEQPPLWGLRTVVTSAVDAGTVYVGAFKLGGSVIRKGGVSVNIANTNEDDFIKNVITILIEERLALAVRYPGAFVKLAKKDA